jgi:glucose-6-phosphate isomerase
MPIPTPPDFRSPRFLADHALWIMEFYGDRAIDPTGGMYHFFLDDGTVYDRRTRHLVSATRFVVTHAIAHLLSGEERYRRGAAHAFRFLRDGFADCERGGFAWTIRWEDGRARVTDSTRHMYGLAFVMLAAARAHDIGIAGAHELLEQTFELAENRFFEPAAQLYADEATPQWVVSGYRGQNANMHACEAAIAAFEATADSKYLQRADQLAQAITVREAAYADGGIWEHYRADWTPDWDYNRLDRSNIFRPWGFQPGHFTEWAKLLCQLDTHLPRPWHVPRARELFDRAVDIAWDRVNGGLHYGFAPDGTICDADKYHWVQAESLAAAALLALRSGDARYWDWYERIWNYCWQHFVDHRDGAWFRILTAENFRLTREKSPAGKVDYHDIGACYDVWRSLAPGVRRGTRAEAPRGAAPRS